MSKVTRYILFGAFHLVCLFLIFGGLILQDYANKPGWWGFWTYSPIGGFLGFLYGVFILPKQILPKTGKK